MLPQSERIKEVPQWIYQNQLSRRNLTDEQRGYLIGKQYEHQKKRHGAPVGNQYAKKQSGKNYHSEKSEEVVAKEHGLSPKTVRNYEQYAKAVDTITENLGNETKEKILTASYIGPVLEILLHNIPLYFRL